MTRNILEQVLAEMPADARDRLLAQAQDLDRPLEGWLHGQPSPTMTLGAFADRILTRAGRNLMALRSADPLTRAGAMLQGYGHASERMGNTLVITTDLLDAHNDMVQVHIQSNGEGTITLHDDADTLEDLALCGLDVEKNRSAKTFVTRQAAGHGVALDGKGRLHRTMPATEIATGNGEFLRGAVAGVAQACAVASALLIQRESET